MAQALLILLMAYAVAGLVVSLTVHVLAIAGFRPGGNGLFFALHIGIFPLWIPVAIIARKMAQGTRLSGAWGWNDGGSFWKAALSASPRWMRNMTYGFFVYAVVNFLLFIVLAMHMGKPVNGETPAFVWRGFSGHWMVFYAAGLAILTSAYQKGLSNLEPRCPNGHGIGYGDRYCPTCGTPIVQPR